MPSPVELAAHRYIQAWTERDPVRRAKLVDACFAADGRMVTQGREIRGRAALLAEMSRVLSNPELADVRVVSAIDARGTTFRYRAIAEMRDGRCIESFDAGEIDADGRIRVVLTFTGALGEGVATTAEEESR